MRLALTMVTIKAITKLDRNLVRETIMRFTSYFDVVEVNYDYGQARLVKTP